MEGGALDVAFSPNVAAVGLDNVFGNRQAQSRTGVFGVAGRVNLVEAFKNPGKFIRGNAHAGVGDAHRHPVGFIFFFRYRM